MDDPEISSIYVREPRGVTGILRRVEKTVSIAVSVLIVLEVLVGGGFLTYTTEGKIVFVPLLLVWICATVGQFIFLAWLKTARDGIVDDPFMPQFALRQPRWPVAVRPLIVVFWLAHFLVTMLFLVGFEEILQPAGYQWVGIIALVATVWALSHCSQMFLLLAASALYRSEPLINELWRRRFLIDLAMTGVAMVFLHRLRK